MIHLRKYKLCGCYPHCILMVVILPLYPHSQMPSDAQDTGKCLSVKIGHQGYREDVGEPGVGWTLSERPGDRDRDHRLVTMTQFAGGDIFQSSMSWGINHPNNHPII